MQRTDDPVLDEINHTLEAEEKIKRFPICIECEEHIQDDGAYCIYGDWYCKRCIDSFWKWID